MKMSEDLIKKLSSIYEPSVMIKLRYKDKDILFKTDEKGNPILLFVGKLSDDGLVRGERFTRKLVYDREGKVICDRYDNKGKAT